MSLLLFSNNAQSTLASAITSSQTTIPLASGTGALFPNPGSGQYFVLSITDAATQLLHEICWVTAVSGDTLTVERGQEGTTALSWNLGDLVDNGVTAGQMETVAWFGGGQIFSAVGTTTFTVPNSVVKIRARLWGGGGGGANSTGSGEGGPGGGGGGYCEGVIGVTPGQTLDIVVGAGGANHYPLADSGDASSITGTSLSAGGGGGASTAVNGSGGSGSGGYFNASGDQGGYGVALATGCFCGTGGSSFGFAGHPQAFATGAVGQNGWAPGVGGNGGLNGDVGGSGAAGQVVLEW